MELSYLDLCPTLKKIIETGKSIDEDNRPLA